MTLKKELIVRDGKSEAKIALGQQAKDKVTGLQGILTGRSTFIYGCDQYCIVPPIDKDGKMPEAHWFDEGRIQVTGPGIVPEDVQVKDPGGPQRDAPKAR
jgi:hypothetical protein